MNKPLKQKKCKECGDLFIPMSSMSPKVCSFACAIDFGKKDTAIKSKEKAKKAKKEFYEQDLKWQHKQCQPVFNKLRRLQELKWFKDNNQEPCCISCSGGIGNDIWCNGHFKSVGSSSALRYDFKNSYLQHNERCNRALSADINGTATTHGYKQGLINRFGIEVANEIMAYCEANAATVTRWTWQELKVMRQQWNKEIRELEKYLELV